MSVFKRLNKSDIVVTPFIANKSWSFDNTNLFTYIFKGTKLTGSFNSIVDPIYNGEYERLIYDNVNHLYYQEFNNLLNTGSLVSSLYYLSASSNRPTDIYNQYIQSYRDYRNTFPTGVGDSIHTINIPQNIYGSKIKPSTFTLTSSAYNIKDDGFGNLIDYTISTASYVGNIIYSHGLAIITSQSYQNIFTSSYNCLFLNEHIVYENTIKCTVRDFELNLSYNPTLRQILTASESPVYDFTTGSEFSPYATTVGLHNDAGDLLIVGKLSQSLPLSPNTDTTFIINYDT